MCTHNHVLDQIEYKIGIPLYTPVLLHISEIMYSTEFFPHVLSLNGGLKILLLAEVHALSKHSVEPDHIWRSDG